MNQRARNYSPQQSSHEKCAFNNIIHCDSFPFGNDDRSKNFHSLVWVRIFFCFENGQTWILAHRQRKRIFIKSYDIQQSRNTEISNRAVFVGNIVYVYTFLYPVRKTIFRELVGQSCKLNISNCIIWLVSLHSYTSLTYPEVPEAGPSMLACVFNPST